MKGEKLMANLGHIGVFIFVLEGSITNLANSGDLVSRLKECGEVCKRNRRGSWRKVSRIDK